MKVLIIDYGMGNVGSVKRAIEECGVEDVVISHHDYDFEDCTHAILPGVGAFPDAMTNLKDRGLVQSIRKLSLEDKVPLLGICLGMQLLASEGTEGSRQAGLGLIPGLVKGLEPVNGERIPHVGWNEIHFQQPDDPFFENVKDRTDFYFVHSFFFTANDAGHVLASTPYCGSFASVIRSNNIIGTQFHPEKSSTTGFQLLRNFLKM